MRQHENAVALDLELCREFTVLDNVLERVDMFKYSMHYGKTQTGSKGLVED